MTLQQMVDSLTALKAALFTANGKETGTAKSQTLELAERNVGAALQNLQEIDAIRKVTTL